MKIVEPFSGIGDTIMIRPFIRALAAREDVVYIKTPWPDLFEDFENVKCYKPDGDYRTQSKHMKTTSPSKWHTLPKRYLESDKFKMFYKGEDLIQRSIFATFEKQCPLEGTPFVFDLPAWAKKEPIPEIKNNGKPIAVIRPVTERAEWIAKARQPLPDYLVQISKILMDSGYHVVSVADTVPRVEWIVGNEPYAHQKFHKGELDFRKLVSLVQQCDISVGGVGFITPMGIASGNPHMIVFGGQGRYNCLENITDYRMDLRRVGYIMPERFCRCTDLVHDCNKLIKDVPEKFWNFMVSVQRLDRG